MKKNDKLIVILGVVILVLASIGVFYWVPEAKTQGKASVDDFKHITGTFKENPSALIVSDCDPFYPLIGTPIACHYDSSGQQIVMPLLIQNMDEPSDAVTRLKEQIGYSGEIVIDGSVDSKSISLDMAETYWDETEAALIIENNKEGYELGIVATPIASYLCIPVIITDEIDSHVTEVLSDLGVKKTLVCGDLKGYGNTLKLESVEQINDIAVELLEEKFLPIDSDFKVDYITIANPIDAWRPEVLDTEEYHLSEKTVKSTSFSQLTNLLSAYLTGSAFARWEFDIPKGYKYALVEFEGYNHDAEYADSMGDSASFDIGANLEDIPAGLQSFEILAAGSTGTCGTPIRDASGQIVKDKVSSANVVYGRDGVTYTVAGTGSWLTKKEGTISGYVKVSKLEHPVYEFMEGLSSIAPYLTAYRKGIVFAKPEFAFTANDSILCDGEHCYGHFMPRRNVNLVEPSNKHIQDTIIDPLNELLAKLAGITDVNIKDDRDLRILYDHYRQNPTYISIVGGAVVVPNFIYQNHVEPYGDIDGDGVDDTAYYVGGGTPSDVIYGNIDPVRYDNDNKAQDQFSEYPQMENIVGRITGWDAQDASALIARTVFYEQILGKYQQWKDKFAILVGGGQDFRKPLMRYLIFGDLLGMIKRGEPMKLHTGYAEMVGLRMRDEVAEPLEFEPELAFFSEAMIKGLSDDVLNEVKQANLLNKLFFSKNQVASLAGENVVKGGEIIQECNFLFLNGHGNQHFFGMSGNDLVAAGLGGPIMHWFLKQTMIPILGGFSGPGADLGKVGDYTVRSVSDVELGPSFMFLESCITGKIDGIDPRINIGQAFLHAGVNSLIASPTGTNIGGGYLEPKNRMYDVPGESYLKYIKNKNKDWKNEEYDDPHFGLLFYDDLCYDLQKNDVSVGLAFRNAKNKYLEQDADWELLWAPPLPKPTSTAHMVEMSKSDDADMIRETSSKDPYMLEAKYITYQEYFLFGDPAFNPYEPINEG